MFWLFLKISLRARKNAKNFRGQQSDISHVLINWWHQVVWRSIQQNWYVFRITSAGKILQKYLYVCFVIRMFLTFQRKWTLQSNPCTKRSAVKTSPKLERLKMRCVDLVLDACFKKQDFGSDYTCTAMFFDVTEHTFLGWERKIHLTTSLTFEEKSHHPYYRAAHMYKEYCRGSPLSIYGGKLWQCKGSDNIFIDTQENDTLIFFWCCVCVACVCVICA